MKEQVGALPEQDNYVPYHEDDFMFLFSDDKHDNMPLLSELYSSEYTRIDSLCVCKEEKRHLHDILNIMTRSMSKSKKTNVSPIYPLKGKHKKPEHVKSPPVVEQIVQEQVDQTEPADIPDVVDLPEPNEVPFHSILQKVHEQPVPLQQRLDIYPPRMKRPNPLLEPSSYPQVMAKQLPKYEGLLKPQPIEIELRGRLPSYDLDKAIEKYPFTMDSPSIEELKEKKRKLFSQ